MAVNINEFKVFVEFVANKVQVGNSVTIAQFNELAHRAQMEVFEQGRQRFLETEEMSDFMSFFLKNIITSVPVTGLLPYPSDWQHTASVRSYFIPPGEPGIEIKVQEVKNSDYGAVIQSQLQTPTKEYPKYSEFSDALRFLPRNIGLVMIDYFREPVRPIWGYVTTSGRPVYDAATSTNFEWDETYMNGVAA